MTTDQRIETWHRINVDAVQEGQRARFVWHHAAYGVTETHEGVVTATGGDEGAWAGEYCLWGYANPPDEAYVQDSAP